MQANTHDFRKLWLGQTISEVGSRVSREGLPMTAVLLLHATPWQMGILSATGTSAVLIFGLAAGVVADRMRRRPLMIFTDVARAIVLMTVPVAALSGQLTMVQLLVVSALTGLLSVLFDVSYQAYLPTLIGKEALLEGNRKLAMSVAAAEILGPGLTGVLIQLLTAPVAILLDAVSFLVSALSVAAIRQPEPYVKSASTGLPSRVELLEGLRVIRHNPMLRALTLRTATASLSGGFFMPLYILFALRVLGLSTVQLGVTIALGGVGAITGAWVTRYLGERYPAGTVFFVSAFFMGTTVLCIPLAATFPESGLLFLCLAQFFGDGAYSFLNVSETTFRQRVVDEAVLGRANAVVQLASRGMLPVGALLGGYLADRGGITLTLWLGGVGYFLSSFWLLPLLRYVSPSGETMVHSKSI
ncbi:MAG: MFS transporter [Bryobacteraceae bacterium]|nr:MFS transporter [Bryobacteraceae bacterium]